MSAFWVDYFTNMGFTLLGAALLWGFLFMIGFVRVHTKTVVRWAKAFWEFNKDCWRWIIDDFDFLEWAKFLLIIFILMQICNYIGSTVWHKVLG